MRSMQNPRPMKRPTCNVCLGVMLAFALPVSLAAGERSNVLLIAIDDLNDWVGCLEGHPQTRTPHIDRLAARGALFTNAHCQAPICNPSRTSIMYGLRPSTTGIYMNAPTPWTVDAMRNRPSMPRHFQSQGYTTYTTGKIYHGSGMPPNDFQVVGPRPGQRLSIDERLVPAMPDGAKGLWDFGAQRYDEGKFQDHLDATWAIEMISAHNDERPFFMAIGFYRPHVPLYSPERVFREIPVGNVQLPKVRLDDRDDLPAIVDEVTIAPAAPKHQWFVESGRWQEAVASYLSCVRWTDAQVGRLMDALASSPHADNTIVVLFSDHGFFLGEKQRWAKQSLWERATHVPLIIDAPGQKSSLRIAKPVELLSIFPTLIDLCGLPEVDSLEGVSLSPLLNDPATVWPHCALTTHGPSNHAVRSETHRYIRYRDGSEELYDLRGDPNEWTNIASDPQHASTKQSLARHFPKENAPEAKRAKRSQASKQQ